MQSRTGTIISGSNAVQFMDRAYYEDADLDIYVNPDHCADVGMHMILIQGYRITDPSNDGTERLNIQDSILHVKAMAVKSDDHIVNPSYPNGSIHSMCFLERTTEAGRVQEAQIIVTSNGVFHAILDFHSTCVMNIITFDRAIAMYPLASFENRTNQVMAQHTASPDNNQGVQDAIAKYDGIDRNFPHRVTRSAREARLLFQHGIDRKLGDRFCWTIKFPMSGIELREAMETIPWPYEPTDSHALVESEVTQDPILENKWRMSGHRTCLALKYCLLRLPIFKYGYAVADDTEALRARKFSDDIGAVKKYGGCQERKWFDDTVSVITQGDIQVLLNDENITDYGSPDIPEHQLENHEHWPGCGFPLKVTHKIDSAVLGLKLSRYRESWEMEEISGKVWRRERDRLMITRAT
ncbi:hypothetical protein HWV62_19151 [Athelia sp. TMB]|nr:hypothetical protein HWV62_19151 [Athelia sp. TMB]